MPPPRKPSHLRAVEGNPSHARPENKDEPIPAKGYPDAPSYFSEQESAWYKEMCAELHRWGVITVLDARAMEMMTKSYSEFRQADEEIRANGSLTISTLGSTGQEVLKSHPSITVRDSAWKKFRAMATEFGMTPASRSKIVATKQGDADVVDDLLNRKRK